VSLSANGCVLLLFPEAPGTPGADSNSLVARGTDREHANGPRCNPGEIETDSALLEQGSAVPVGLLAITYRVRWVGSLTSADVPAFTRPNSAVLPSGALEGRWQSRWLVQEHLLGHAARIPVRSVLTWVSHSRATTGAQVVCDRARRSAINGLRLGWLVDGAPLQTAQGLSAMARSGTPALAVFRAAGDRRQGCLRAVRIAASRRLPGSPTPLTMDFRRSANPAERIRGLLRVALAEPPVHGAAWAVPVFDFMRSGLRVNGRRSRICGPTSDPGWAGATTPCMALRVPH